MEFHLAYYPFWRLARRLTRAEFIRILSGPEGLEGILHLNERSIALSCDMHMGDQPPLLHRFLVSLEEKRSFEIELLEKGIAACYPERPPGEAEELFTGLGLRKSA